jgi:hypothetical protein
MITRMQQYQNGLHVYQLLTQRLGELQSVLSSITQDDPQFHNINTQISTVSEDMTSTIALINDCPFSVDTNGFMLYKGFNYNGETAFQLLPMVSTLRGYCRERDYSAIVDFLKFHDLTKMSITVLACLMRTLFSFSSEIENYHTTLLAIAKIIDDSGENSEDVLHGLYNNLAPDKV